MGALILSLVGDCYVPRWALVNYGIAGKMGSDKTIRYSSTRYLPIYCSYHVSNKTGRQFTTGEIKKRKIMYSLPDKIRRI
jgi:hypothetical protein